jgi:hypothetical protein
MSLARGVDLEDIPVCVESGPWWRQTDPKYDALSLPHLAGSGGRCHRKGQQPRCYASSTENVAWGELFRHSYGEVSPYEMRRAMSQIQVTELPVVDFEDPLVRALFNVPDRALVSNDYAACRKVADLLRQRPDLFGGMILPSAAVPGERTLVVFSEWIADHVTVVERWEPCTASTRLLPLFRSIADTLPSRTLRKAARAFVRELEHEIAANAKRDVVRLIVRL